MDYRGEIRPGAYTGSFQERLASGLLTGCTFDLGEFISQIAQMAPFPFRSGAKAMQRHAMCAGAVSVAHMRNRHMTGRAYLR